VPLNHRGKGFNSQEKEGKRVAVKEVVGGEGGEGIHFSYKIGKGRLIQKGREGRIGAETTRTGRSNKEKGGGRRSSLKASVVRASRGKKNSNHRTSASRPPTGREKGGRETIQFHRPMADGRKEKPCLFGPQYIDYTLERGGGGGGDGRSRNTPLKRRDTRGGRSVLQTQRAKREEKEENTQIENFQLDQFERRNEKGKSGAFSCPLKYPGRPTQKRSIIPNR